MSEKTKGFTLLELLIVIGILAILAGVVVLVLNPAELLRQARDSQRISDLSTMRSAISLYLASVDAPNIGVGACVTTCYVNIDVDNAASEGCAGTTDGLIAGPNGAARHGTKSDLPNAVRLVNASGWVPINFAGIPGGSPVGVLPVDPINNTTHFYSYACDGTKFTFEMIFRKLCSLILISRFLIFKYKFLICF